MKIFFLVLNNFVNDTRVLKETRTVERFTNLPVQILALHKTGLKLQEKVGEKSSVYRLSLLLNLRILPGPVRHLLAYLEWTTRAICKVLPWEGNRLILHVHDLKPLPVAVLLKLFSLGKAQIIYDCHEYETEVQAYNSNASLKKTAKLIESFCLKYVFEVICVTRPIAEAYVQDYGIRLPKLVMNCPYKNDSKKNNIFRQKFSISDEQLIFLYQGGIIKGRGVEESIEVFNQLGHEFVLVFLGFGDLVPEVQEAAKRNNRIFYHEAVSSDILIDYSSSADFGLCFINNICKSYFYSLPNKFFEYIHARIPIIVNPMYELKTITTMYNLGLVSADESLDSIKSVIREIASLERSKFNNGLDLAAKKFCWEEQEKIIFEIYRKLI